MWFKFILVFLVFFLISIKQASADELNSFITVVNPVRLSSYNPDPVSSIKSQIYQINKRNINSTWLLTSDVLQNEKMVMMFKNLNDSQEIGLFLEVTPGFSSRAGVIYNETGSWHHASSVFLSGYKQSDRIKLIDNIFSDFKNKFGYYPKSVGAWWIDSYSLEYMENNYGITANLSCADQFSTDGYQIWGTYWSTPYFPSKFNSAMPSQSEINKIGVVTIQWAHRDPADGYYDSRFSTQDYFTTPGKKIEYFNYLVDTYLHRGDNEFSQITIGLEGDFLPETYQGEFSSQLDKVVEVRSKKAGKDVTMSDFSEWYRSKFTNNSPNHLIEGEISWFNTPFYRIGFKKDPVEIIDLRVYSDETREPYYLRRNSGNKLEINLPSLIDSFSRPQEKLVFGIGSDIKLATDEIVIYNPGENKLPPRIINRPGVLTTTETDKISITFSGKSLGNGDGAVINDWSSESRHFFMQLKFPMLLLNKQNWKMLTKVPMIISQDEVESLEFLKYSPDGKVLVPDEFCLQCEWNGKYKPSSYENSRSYIKKYSKKDYVKNKNVFISKNREESLSEFKKSNAKYIYLTKYEGKSERIPFSPGDLGVDLLYENANSQVWVKK